MSYFILVVKGRVICATAYVLHRILAWIFDRLEADQHLTGQVCSLSRGFARWFIIIAAVLLILQQLDMEASYILVAMSTVAVLIAVGFVAVWSVRLSSLCAFLLVLFPPFRFGDVIEVKDWGSRAK